MLTMHIIHISVKFMCFVYIFYQIVCNLNLNKYSAKYLIIDVVFYVL